jgi:hypothetical protein
VRYFGADTITVTPSTDTRFDSFTEVSADVYTLNFVPGAEGEYVISIAADAVEDLYANLNTVSNDLTFTFDTTEPTTVLSSTEFTQVRFCRYRFSLRRLRLQRGQGRGRVRIQVLYKQTLIVSSKGLSFTFVKIKAKLLTGFVKSQTKLLWS